MPSWFQKKSGRHKVVLDISKSRIVDINHDVFGVQHEYCKVGRNCVVIKAVCGTEIGRCEFLLEEAGEIYCTYRGNDTI
jgi:hypothetical protein